MVDRVMLFCEIGQGLDNFVYKTTFRYEVECLVLWAVVIVILVCQLLNPAIFVNHRKCLPIVRMCTCMGQELASVVLFSTQRSPGTFGTYSIMHIRMDSILELSSHEYC